MKSTIMPAVAVLALTASSLLAAAPGAGASPSGRSGGCNVVSYTSEAGWPGVDAHWPATGHWATVSSGCTSIGLMTHHTRTVRVCTPSACNTWKEAKKEVWTTIAHNAIPGKQFYVQFRNVNASSGQIAY
ncbi:hypothetical protein [Streptomyces spectabilis]|uniref:Uncharacterized protein n=1 Tax=Streptomyces spectabilis TaxID=68270 RepID=A0A5P2WX32_STRST|nr:hypothetical protein [Streptomyces spectabilis]MBB5108032.1 hypothetical protein [Streptomyces spectabilis]MCI3907844.1 hypothetical protein [Streptomyces spectabilis]MCI3907871.1 hypothetical protein [Streptomyces spectabilis]QEV57333.1 hypothetical protein CP982_00065 [Streptomyces spectabilis]GGV53138.1 hypothetical protein GCM10010245_83720 [Streptomyces spectabilis]